MKKVFKNLAEFLFGCAEIGFRAYVMTVLWAWFVVSTFGLPALTIPAVLGIHMLYGVFKYNPRVKVEQAEETGVVANLAGIFISLIALGCGYVIHLGM